MYAIENTKTLPTMRELRRQKCMGIPEIARLVNARENTVYRWERGDVAPKLIEALLISDALGVRVDEVNWWPRGVVS